MNKPVPINPKSTLEQLAARTSGDGIIVTDAEGMTLWVNEAFTRMTGFQPEEMLGLKPGAVLQGPDTDIATVRSISVAIRERRPILIEILNYHKVGPPYWVEMNITPIFDSDGRHTHFVSVERDITSRKAIETQSREVIQREKHREGERQLLGQVSEWLYSAKSLDELLLVARRALSTLIPEAEGSLYIYSENRDTLEVASAWGDHPSIDSVNPDECWALRRGRAYSFGTRAIEFKCEHVENEDYPFFCLPIVADGETIWMLHLRFTSFPLATMDRKMIETFIEHRWHLCLLCAEQMSLAIANVRLRQVLLDRSVRDPLTSLWNRRWLVETMERMIAQARAGETELSLISIDVDHFKAFNDRFGHDAGDLVLREVAAVLVDVARDRGAACRSGGEEFAILCPGLDNGAAMALADDLRTRLSVLQLRYDGRVLPPVTVSAGVASYVRGASADALLLAADHALYHAKDQGRDRTVSAVGLSQMPDAALGAPETHGPP